MILERDYILEQDLDACESLLKKALKNPDLNKPLIENPYLHENLDAVANTICYLEDRIAHLQQLANLEKANAIRWGKTVD